MITHLSQIREQFPILQNEKRGTLQTLTLRGKSKDIGQLMEHLKPTFWELLPLTLEEIFISETEVQGYDFKGLYE